jgi:hypothetical protein
VSAPAHPPTHTHGHGHGPAHGHGSAIGRGAAAASHGSSHSAAPARNAVSAGSGSVGSHNGPSRSLVLVFKTKSAGLTFQAAWLDADKKTKHPALGPDAHANGNGHVTSGERAKLIGLAAYARKAHFHYNQESGVYLMESLVEIPNYLKTVLPTWKRLFVIELDEKSANLLKGTRTVEIEAVAERAAPRAGAAGGEALNLRWIFRAGERMLTDTEVNALLKRHGQPVILSGPEYCGFGHYVTHRHDARVLNNPEDPSEIAEGLRALSSDQTLRTHLLSHAAELVGSLSWAATAHKYEALYAESIEARRVAMNASQTST